MAITNTKEPIVLAMGDFLVMFVSLVVTLTVRYLDIPSEAVIKNHSLAFSLTFAFSILSLSIAGLYGKRLTLVKGNIPGMLIKAQIANLAIALSLFYLVPVFVLAPKTNLFIYIIISTGLLILWRFLTFKIFARRKKQNALIVVTGKDVEEIVSELQISTRSMIHGKIVVREGDGSSDENIKKGIDDQSITHFVADLSHPSVQRALPHIYHSAFPRVQVVDARDFYMELFDRVPLSAMGYEWILGKVNASSAFVYDFGKRAMDIILSIPLALVTIIIHPLVCLAIRLEDGSPCLIKQDRVGLGGKSFTIYKYRSMKVSDGGKWLTEGDERVTKVGKFLRKSRIDELPQVLAVLNGSLSLIGPRPDIKDLGDMLKKDIGYYEVRTLIKPGLSGWAQVNQEKPPQSVEETKVRLSYDVYYVIHRSLSLDLRIAFRTIKTLLSRVGM